MKKIIILIFLIFFSFSVYAHDSNSPFLKNNGEKWRIGYIEGGCYNDYQLIFIQTLKELQKLGWLEPFTYTYNESYCYDKKMWKYLIKNVKSDYIEFVNDAFYSSSFNYQLNVINGNMMNDRNDLDLIFAMGTWAGKELINQKHNIPTIVLSASDPIKSKIIKSVHDSGYDHLHAKVEPDRYKNQIKLFDNIVYIKKLGFIYEDSNDGKAFAAYDDIYQVANERGFLVESCIAKNNDVSKEKAEQNAIDCYKKLAPLVDSFYITAHRGENIDNIPRLIDILIKYKVKSFAMVGDEYVENGALISISHGNFSYVSKFHAETIIEIFHGKLPRYLKQEWKAPDKISINLDTAKKIGYNFSFEILSTADNIFQ